MENLVTKNETANVDLSLPRQAESDAHLIELWLHGRSHHTQRAYRADVDRFMATLNMPFPQITLGDIQHYATALSATDLKPASIHRALSAVKSLFAFGHRLGYFSFDTARPLFLPGFRDGLADRILEESQIHRMMAMESHPRNHVVLVLLYSAGLRVSELCSMKWRDLQARGNSGQITICGKRNKTRSILLPRSVFTQLVGLQSDASEDAPIFLSRKKAHLSAAQIWRIVRKAAQRAGIEKLVSPHWMRHGHASHALDRGAPISLVQATLGHSSISTTGRYAHAMPSESSSKYLSI